MKYTIPTPLDIVLYTSSYAMFIKNQNHQNNNIIIEEMLEYRGQWLVILFQVL